MSGWSPLRASARLWWLHVYNGSGTVPVPRDAPSIRSGYSDADRVLLIGNGAAGGWQVRTYGLALAGQLAAALQRVRSRGCDLDQVGDEVMNVRSASAWLGKRSLKQYDAVVVVLGLSDAVRLTSVTSWRASLGDLLTRLLDDTRPEVRVVIAGIEPVRMSRVFHGPLALLAQRNADRLNHATHALADTSRRVEYIELGEPHGGSIPRSAASVYTAWAMSLAPTVAEALEQAAPVEHIEPLPVQLPARPSPTAPAAQWVQMRTLLDDAKAEFRADVAWISLLDGDRYTLPVASVGNSPSEVPLELTFCVHTMQQDGALVVPNVKRDPRFRDNPFLDVVHFEFYAGHRLQSDDGTTVGTICVASIRPRPASAVDPQTLASYARLAETELSHIRDTDTTTHSTPEAPVRSSSVPPLESFSQDATSGSH